MPDELDLHALLPARDRLAYFQTLALAALRAGLLEPDRRPLLLEGVEAGARALLVAHRRPLDQAFSDVCALARVDACALDNWLRNCAFLARPDDARFFHAARLELADLFGGELGERMSILARERGPDG